eukprot:jgi/Botrbrau1/20250/Bobra.31_1s0039.3
MAAQALGAAVPNRFWTSLACEMLCCPANPSTHHANGLIVMSALFFGAGIARQVMDEDAVALVAHTMLNEDVSVTRHPGINLQLLVTIENLIKIAGPMCVANGHALWRVLLQLSADHASKPHAQILIANLANLCSFQSPEEMASEYSHDVVAALAKGYPVWTSASHDVLVLTAILETCHGQSLAKLLPTLLPIFCGILSDMQRDAALHLILLQTLDKVIQLPANADVLRSLHSSSLLRGCLLPQLVWRPGKTAASLRYAALVTLVSFLQYNALSKETVKEHVENGSLLPSLFQSMEEDRFSSMRVQGCMALEQIIAVLCNLEENVSDVQEGMPEVLMPHTQHVGIDKGSSEQSVPKFVVQELPDALCRDLYPELLKRLDDSENTVRIAACRTLTALVEGMSDAYDATHVQYLTSNLLVHMDDTDSQVQEAVCATACRLAKVQPELMKEELKKVRDVHKSTKYIDRISDLVDTVKDKHY